MWYHTHVESEVSGGRGRKTKFKSILCQSAGASLVVEPLLGMSEALVWSLALRVNGRHSVRDPPWLKASLKS